MILAAAANAEVKGWAGVRGKAQEDTKTLAEKGIVVSEPSAELMAELNKIGATMIEEWKAEAPEVEAILSNFNQ